MVRMISDKPSSRKKRTHRNITFEFEYKNENDIALIEKIRQLCEEQPRCDNCAKFYYEGSFCGYRACCCEIHGVLERPDNPYYGMDASKCEDYCRKEN